MADLMFAKWVGSETALATVKFNQLLQVVHHRKVESPIYHLAVALIQTLLIRLTKHTSKVVIYLCTANCISVE